jgi:hypothetical protein
MPPMRAHATLKQTFAFCVCPTSWEKRPTLPPDSPSRVTVLTHLHAISVLHHNRPNLPVLSVELVLKKCIYSSLLISCKVRIITDVDQRQIEKHMYSHDGGSTFLRNVSSTTIIFTWLTILLY